MKKLEIIIRPEKLEESNVNGLNIANIMGYGNQKGVVKRYRGAEYRVNLLPKIKVETVVSDEVSEALIDKIVKEINTGNYGDGKIFVYDVQYRRAWTGGSVVSSRLLYFINAQQSADST